MWWAWRSRGVRRLHATCNLADYTLGLGAQGRLPEHWSELERAMHRGHSAVVQKKLKKLKKKSLDRWLSHAVEPLDWLKEERNRKKSSGMAT